MSEKGELEKGIEQLDRTDKVPNHVPHRQARGDILIVLVVVALIFYGFVRLLGVPFMCDHGHGVTRLSEQRWSSENQAVVSNKVTLEAHIMYVHYRTGSTEVKQFP